MGGFLLLAGIFVVLLVLVKGMLVLGVGLGLYRLFGPKDVAEGDAPDVVAVTAGQRSEP